MVPFAYQYAACFDPMDLFNAGNKLHTDVSDRVPQGTSYTLLCGCVMSLYVRMRRMLRPCNGICQTCAPIPPATNCVMAYLSRLISEISDTDDSCLETILPRKLSHNALSCLTGPPHKILRRKLCIVCKFYPLLDQFLLGPHYSFFVADQPYARTNHRTDNATVLPNS